VCSGGDCDGDEWNGMGTLETSSGADMKGRASPGDDRGG
jgi:hypothetical protein